jgi:putative proteasome-type protease
MFGGPTNELVIMTSGLRSLRDKTLAYLRRSMQRRGAPYDSMFDAVTDYSTQLRDVAKEEHAVLERADLKFNLHAIICGQLAEDSEPGLFLVYPEGNWLEVDTRTPYLSIGETTYGKPILDRALNRDTSLRNAVKLAYLSFDSTRISATHVGFPIDILTYRTSERTWREAHYEHDDLLEQRQWWNKNLMELATKLPDDLWVDTLVPPVLQMRAGD